MKRYSTHLNLSSCSGLSSYLHTIFQSLGFMCSPLLFLVLNIFYFFFRWPVLVFIVSIYLCPDTKFILRTCWEHGMFGGNHTLDRSSKLLFNCTEQTMCRRMNKIDLGIFHRWARYIPLNHEYEHPTTATNVFFPSVIFIDTRP